MADSWRDPAAVYISLTSPPKIVEASPEWLAMFRLDAKRCLGRTLNCVQGPETAAVKLAGLVDGVRSAKAVTARVVLYTSEGEKALYFLCASPARGPLGHPPVCKLTMVKCPKKDPRVVDEVVETHSKVTVSRAGCFGVSSDAVQYKMAVADDGRCKLIVEAAKPFRIVCSSDEFERKYGFTREQVVNRSLSFIQGPDTDMSAWLGLFDSVLAGRSQHLPLVHTYARNGTDESVCLRLTPVLGTSDINFVLVVLDPPEHSSAVYPPKLFRAVSESASCPCPTEVATVRPSRVRPNESHFRSRTSSAEPPPPQMGSQEPCQRSRRLSAKNMGMEHKISLQHAPDSRLLSHENVLAHEQALVHGVVWHDWHAVREHEQRCQSGSLLSCNISALARPEWPRAQANISEICSKACPSIAEETWAERQRDRDVTRERQEETRETTRNVGPLHTVTPADIMARWNLGSAR